MVAPPIPFCRRTSERIENGFGPKDYKKGTKRFVTQTWVSSTVPSRTALLMDHQVDISMTNQGEVNETKWLKGSTGLSKRIGGQLGTKSGGQLLRGTQHI